MGYANNMQDEMAITKWDYVEPLSKSRLFSAIKEMIFEQKRTF